MIGVIISNICTVLVILIATLIVTKMATKKAEGFPLMKYILPLVIAVVVLGIISGLPKDFGYFEAWAKMLKATLRIIAILLVIVILVIGFIARKKDHPVAAYIFVIAFLTLILWPTISMVHGCIFNFSNDHFGSRHPIPSDMEYFEPANLADSADFDQLTQERTVLLIKNPKETGFFYFRFYLPEVEEGECYIKLYEATSNTLLSKYEWGEDSDYDNIIVSPADSTHFYGRMPDYEEDFDGNYVYEGKEGEPYAARVELWFKPTDKEPICIAAPIYKIEGCSFHL